MKRASVLAALVAVPAGLSLFLLPGESPATPVYGYRIVQTYPHDPNAFTQGLVYSGGYFYEGTGMIGRSSVRKVEWNTGRVVKKTELPPPYFGEGVTLWKDKLIELTWQSRIGFVYDRETLRQLRTFTYSIEGWGLTHDGKRLIVSDGSPTLYFWDPETFKEVGRIEVTDHGQPVKNLNELEYIGGEVYANIWQADRVARISPATGRVLAWIDLSGLLSDRERAGGAEVLNGIAYDNVQKRLFVTGKLWPKMFEIQLVRRGAR